MQFHPNELFVYYNPNTPTGKKVRAMAKSISRNLHDVDLNKATLTTTLWKEILNMLNLKPKDLLDKSNREYQEKVKGNTFTMTGWLEILVKCPHLLKAPIAIYRNKAVLCCRPNDILLLDASSRTATKALPHLRAAL